MLKYMLVLLSLLYNSEKYKQNRILICKRQKKYRDTHKKQKKEYDRKYFLKNREKILIYKQKNKERSKHNSLKRYEKNKSKIKKHDAERYKKNKEKNNKYSIMWAKKNPEKMHIIQLRYLQKISDVLDMSSYEYKWALLSWSKTVKKLDNHMCKLCDSKENLNSHHLYPKSEFPKLSLEVDNGITLCKKCHIEIHNI